MSLNTYIIHWLILIIINIIKSFDLILNVVIDLYTFKNTFIIN